MDPAEEVQRDAFKINHNYNTTLLERIHKLHMSTLPFHSFDESFPERLPSFELLTNRLLDARNVYLEVSDPWQGKNPGAPHDDTAATEMTAAVPTPTYTSQFLSLFENEKTLADLIITTQYLYLELRTITWRLSCEPEPDNENEVCDTDRLRHIVSIGIDLSIILLSHFLNLTQVIDTHGLDIGDLYATIQSMINKMSQLSVNHQFAAHTPVFAHSHPGITHFNPFSTTPLATQVQIFNQRYPSHIFPNFGQEHPSLGIERPTDWAIQKNSNLGPIPYHHRGKVFKLVENMAWESRHGYGFIHGLNYLGYADVLSRDNYLGLFSLNSLRVDSHDAVLNYMKFSSDKVAASTTYHRDDKQ